MPVTTQFLSVDAAGRAVNGENSETASISADGKTVFYTNFGNHDAYVHNAASKTNVDVSTIVGLSDVASSDMSADGSEFVYSGTDAMNNSRLVRQNTTTNAVQTISTSAESAQVSGDGMVVAYTQPSGGTSLAAFSVFDTAGNQTKGHFAGNGVDAAAVDAISGSGEFVAFHAAATGGAQFGVASGGNTEIYLGDIANGAAPTLVSVNNKGEFASNAGGTATSADASVSQTGHRVAFVSDATNLAFDAAGNAIATGGQLEIYLRDAATDTTTLISRSATGAASSGSGDDAPVISADGKYVLFDSSGALTPNAGTTEQAYVYNVETGTTTPLSQNASTPATAGGFADNGGESFSADDSKVVFEAFDNGPYVVTLATDTGGTPTVTLAPVAGDGTIDAAEAKAGVTVTGTTTGATGDTIKVFLDGQNGTTGAAVGTGTVAADGTFAVALSASGVAALAQGGHTLLATVQADPTGDYLSGDATASFTLDTVAPTVSSPTVTVASNASATPIGIGAPSDNLSAAGSLAITAATLPTDGSVSLADGTAVTAGQELTAAQLTGLLFTPTAEAAAQTSAFTYTVADAAGNASAGSATLSVGATPPGPTPPGPTPPGPTLPGPTPPGPTPPGPTLPGPTPPGPTPPALGGMPSIDPTVTFDKPGVFGITGTVANSSAVTQVEISATVDGTPQDLGSATLDTDGTFAFDDPVGPHLQGFITATETDGTAGQSQSVASFSLQGGLGGRGAVAEQDSYDPAGDVVTISDLFHGGRSRTVDVLVPDQTVSSTVLDTFRNGGQPGSTFVFTPGYRRDAIHLFRVDGSDHDTISLPSSDFTNIADVLHNTTSVLGNAVITDPTSGDLLQLIGITKAELSRNKSDITLHG